MPGPVSDSIDHEFGTSSNRAMVQEAAKHISDMIGKVLGPKLKNIVEVVYGDPDVEVGLAEDERIVPIDLKEWELRVIRFCLNRFADDQEER